MRGLLQQTKYSNKRAVSEMVSYVLLVVIAVGLSIAVYAYLKVFIPKGEKPECKEDIQLIVQDYTCTATLGKELSVTLYNKGLFRVNAVYLRLGPDGKKVRLNVLERLFNPPLLPGNSSEVRVVDRTKLEPILTTPGKYILEVQPAANSEKGELALCENSVITQTITCT
jgi:hypothetical protein